MNHIPMADLETPRLILRKLRMEDLPQYHSRLTSDPAVAQHMLWNAKDDISHTEATIQRILHGYQTGSRYHWAIVQREDSSLIGTIALLGLDDTRNCASFAYMLGKNWWGLGLGTEALEAVIRFAFDAMEISIIEADHLADNPASGAVMGKVGMERCGILTGKYEKDGVLHDAVQYSITREAWNRQHL